MSKGYEFTSIYDENQIRAGRSLGDPWILSRAEPKKSFAQHISEKRQEAGVSPTPREIIDQTQNRIAICSAKREREKERFGMRLWGREKLSINYSSPFAPPSPPFSLRAFGTRLKNSLSLWPKRNGRVSAYISVINHAFSSHPVSVNYARPFIADSSRPRFPDRPRFISQSVTLSQTLGSPIVAAFLYFFSLVLSRSRSLEKISEIVLY